MVYRLRTEAHGVGVQVSTSKCTMSYWFSFSLYVCVLGGTIVEKPMDTLDTVEHPGSTIGFQDTSRRGMRVQFLECKPKKAAAHLFTSVRSNFTKVLTSCDL